MKPFVTIVLATMSVLQLSAQVTQLIGPQNETIYPVAADRPDDYTDLQACKSIFLQKEIVGMGEATHGTKEFFDLKAKTFRFLVAECGFRVFGIESSYGNCSYINDYIQTGVGNIDSVMHHFDFWTWKTKEVRDLIEWMKQYNQQKPASDKIIFYGFDMQDCYSPLVYLNDFLKNNKQVKYNDLQDITKPVLEKTEMQVYTLAHNDKSLFKDTLQQVKHQLTAWFSDNKSALIDSYNQPTFNRLFFCVQNYTQAIAGVLDAYKNRDSYMADNVIALQKMENRKMFIWAHNGHINLAFNEKDASTTRFPMGYYLRKNIGQQYYAIGQVFNQGSFQAIQGPKTIGSAVVKYLFAKKKLYKGLRECTVPVNPKNTLTNAFSLTNQKAFFVDVSGSNNPLFVSMQKTYDIGAVFMNPKWYVEYIQVKRQFDGLMYVEKTSRAMPLK